MTSEPEDFVDDENGEIALGDTQPSQVKNGRPFLAIAISIIIIVLLALVCTARYAFLSFSPPTSPQRQYLATSVAQANQAAQQAQAVAWSLINQEETPETVAQAEIAFTTPTSTPTQAAPEQTATLTPETGMSKTPTTLPTASQEELTPVSEAVVDTPTSTASVQQTIEPTNRDITPTGEGPGEVQGSVLSPTPGITEDPTASITLEVIEPTRTPEPTVVEEASPTSTQATESAVKESIPPTQQELPETGLGDHLNLPLFLGVGLLFLCLFILARWLRLTWQR